MRALAAAAALLCLAAAPAADPRDELTSGFNTYAIEGLKAAQAWQPDACLSSGWASYRPGYKEIQHMAGGVYYKFSYYSPSHPSSFYHYRPPFQADAGGEVAGYDQKSEQGPGEVDGPGRCIAGMPVTLREAVAAARKAGLPAGPDMVLETARLRVHEVPKGGGRGGGGYMRRWYDMLGREAEVWVVLSGAFVPQNGEGLGPGPWMGNACDPPESVSTYLVDARTGKVLAKKRGDLAPAVDASK